MLWCLVGVAAGLALPLVFQALLVVAATAGGRMNKKHLDVSGYGKQPEKKQINNADP